MSIPGGTLLHLKPVYMARIYSRYCEQDDSQVRDLIGRDSDLDQLGPWDIGHSIWNQVNGYIKIPR